MWTEIGWGRPLPGADGQFCLPTTAIHSSSGSWVWAKLVFHYLYSFSLKENIAQKAQRTRELSAFAKSTYPFWSERERFCGRDRIYMISGFVHHFKRKKKRKGYCWRYRIYMISGSVHHFKRKIKKERIFREISNIRDIRVGASFQKKEKGKG